MTERNQSPGGETDMAKERVTQSEGTAVFPLAFPYHPIDCLPGQILYQRFRTPLRIEFYASYCQQIALLKGVLDPFER
jgi:hypothetical protein